MPDQPYVVVSVAMSLDGFIDGRGEQRLVLSDHDDLDRVDGLRAGCDAILVGAGTVRRDDPRLLVRSAARQAERRSAGRPAHPIAVTVTGSGELAPSARLFTAGEDGPDRLVYCVGDLALARARERLGGVAATLVPVPGERAEPAGGGALAAVLADLRSRGVGRLLVEGGRRVLTELLAEGRADELQVMVAPFVLGEQGGVRFLGDAAFPDGPGHPFALAGVSRLGDQVVLRYLRRPSGSRHDAAHLERAIALSRDCPPSERAFSVGAVVVGTSGEVIAEGYSRQTGPDVHAEEVALARIGGDDSRLSGATLYTSIEPCSSRASRPRSCTQLIIERGVGRVVFAWREPSVFVDCVGMELLAAAGVEVREMPELAGAVREVNAHLLGTPPS